jgi:hypothetical protein
VDTFNNIVIGILTGIIATIITGLAVWGWRRWWNPVVWRFEKIDTDVWQLTRVSGGQARVVSLDDGFGVCSPAISYGLTIPVHRDMPVGNQREVHGLVPRRDLHFALYWISKDRWHGVEVLILPTAERIDIRRRDIGSSSLEKTMRDGKF